MPVSIYPPTLRSTQPAFLTSTSSYPVYFTLQQITSFNQIGHVQIRVVRQSNNRSIVNTEKYPDGTIYKDPSEIRVEGTTYSIAILSTDLSEQWQAGYLYKVQMRFGTTSMFTNISDFATWKQQQIDDQTFSEWSTVMVIKAINQPEVYIKNAEVTKQDVVSTERTEPTLNPLFMGVYSIPDINKELEDKYRFQLYLGDEVSSISLVEDSDWIQHNGDLNSTDNYRFKTVLFNNQKYTVTYEIITVNGYEKSATPYTFLASQNYYTTLDGITLRAEHDSQFCAENGVIRLYLTSNSPLSGAFVVTRSDEKSDYRVWEDIRYLIYSMNEFNNTLIFEDYTVESGVKYRYAFQQENSAGLRSSPVYDPTYHAVNLQYGYLYRDGIQLRLMFNHTISTFKYTVLSSKQDTLGGKYPHVLKNGDAYYAEFPVNGLISFQMDEDQTFFQHGNNGYYYKGELAIPDDKFVGPQMRRVPCNNVGPVSPGGEPIEVTKRYIDSSLTDDNIFVERIFREKVEEFLNDYDYKLYRSPTEGNKIVVLTGVTWSPNATLGRMVAEFNSTAYEVLDNNLQNLNEFGIIDIGHFEVISSTDIHLSFGQIAGIYTSGVRTIATSPVDKTNIYAQIKEQEEVKIGESYRARLERLRYIWVDFYPYIHQIAEHTELEALRAQLIAEGKSTAEVDAQIKELDDLSAALEKPIGVAVIGVNGQAIRMRPNRMYTLTEPIYSLTLISSPYPMIFNYICELTQQEDTSSGVISAIDASRIWGQISGVFTGTDEILKTYNFDYGPNKTPFRVYNKYPDRTVVYDSMGNVIIDNTNFNVYKTINLYDIIVEETRKQVEYIYKVSGGFHQEEDGRWTDGSIYYSFSDILTFDIEANEGTVLYIGKQPDGSDKKTIIIGPTNRYTLSPMDLMVRYIALARPQFCIINYKCLTNQMRVG